MAASPNRNLRATAAAAALPPLLLVFCTAARGAAASAAVPEEGSGEEVCLLQSKQLVSSATKVGFKSSAQSSYGLDTHTWAGLDLPMSGSGLSLLGSRHVPVPQFIWRWAKSRNKYTEPQDPRPKHFRVMGLYNSGTNLLRELLTRNFRAEVTDPRRDRPEAIGGCAFWKHSSLAVLQDEMPSKIRGCGVENLTGIAIVRNPLSWLRSFHRVAYELSSCNKGEDWFNRSCTFPENAPEPSMAGKEFPNVEAIWTQWVQDYERLSSFGFKRSLLIRYEDLVLNTEAVLSSIAAAANLTIPEELETIEFAVHPSPVDRNAARTRAIKQIKTRAYLNNAKTETLQQMCKLLDRKVMRRHDYTDCDDLNL